MLNTLIIIVSLFISESSWAADSHRVNNGVSVEITEHGTCRSVNNTSGKDIFIPTKTSGEWSSFYNNPPPGVAVSSCDLCPGVSTIGATCPNGAIYLGTFNYGGTIGVKKLLITPTGCTDSTTPTCAGGDDTVTKQWQPSFSDIPAASSVNDGLANTIAIMAASGSKPAASFCSDMTFAGLGEWYLPSPEEWSNAVVVNRSVLGWVGGGSSSNKWHCHYWTSRQSSSEDAYVGGQGDEYCPDDVGAVGKANTYGVRCLLRY